MIRQIENADATSAQPAPSQVAPATAAGKSFASVLAHQKSTPTGGASPTTAAAKAAIETPEGEVWTPVPGHDHYAKITDGPRAGQYINLSRGARRGQVFSIEVRGGKTVHVYGQGASQVAVAAGKDSGHVKGSVHFTADQSHPKGEKWAPVKGVSNYADVLSGPRNGLYVNTSGGVRDGMAFQIVKHGDKVFHVYGKGKHRQVIEVGASHTKATHSTRGANGANGSTGAAATTDTTGSTGATGDATGGASPDA